MGDRPRRDGPSMGPRLNDRIRITPVRLIDDKGEMVGIVETVDPTEMLGDLAGLVGLNLTNEMPLQGQVRQVRHLGEGRRSARLR